jgi:hypothetical protein
MRRQLALSPQASRMFAGTRGPKREVVQTGVLTHPRFPLCVHNVLVWPEDLC